MRVVFVHVGELCHDGNSKYDFQNCGSGCFTQPSSARIDYNRRNFERDAIVCPGSQISLLTPTVSLVVPRSALRV